MDYSQGLLGGQLDPLTLAAMLLSANKGQSTGANIGQALMAAQQAGMARQQAAMKLHQVCVYPIRP